MVGDVGSEFDGAEFGDRRLSKRLMTSVEKIAEEPSRAYPHAMMTHKDTEGLYRFFRNPRVTAEAILEPHIAKTSERAREAGSIVCLHDSTEVVLNSTGGNGLYELSTKSYGYLAHVTLAVGAEPELPLGLIGLTVPKRRAKKKKKKPKKQWRTDWSDPNKETRRWYQQAQAVEKRLGGDTDVIHVMDREADSYEIFHELGAMRYVIRLSKDRRAVPTSLLEQVDNAEVLLTREVDLGPRPNKKSKSGKKVPPKTRKTFPTRAPRRAKIAVRAVANVPVLRPQHIPPQFPESIQRNLVEVREIDPPEGAAPVHWLIWTTEPVDTPVQAARVVDLYRLRWLVEEFFGALKTGCGLNQRKPESLQTAINGFALLSVMAWHLILLRQMERASPTAPATTILSKDRIRLLRKMTPKGTLPPNPRVRHIIAAFARLGGHLKSNGPPGWKVLGRGFDDYVRAEHVARMLSST